MPKQLVHFDWAMKYMLRDRENFDVLEGFMSELLGDDIRIEDILESESNKERGDDKFNRVDVRSRSSRGDTIIIEVQVTKELDYFQRILWGACEAVARSIRKGEKYRNVKKVISITVAFFELGQGRDYIYHGTTSFRGIHYKDDVLQLTEEQQKLLKKNEVYEIYPEYYIIKVSDFTGEVRTSLDEWVYLFKNSQIRSGAKAKGIEAAQKKLDILNLTEEEQEQYRLYGRELSYIASINDTQQFLRQQEVEKVLAKGELQGLEKGKSEQSKKIAQAMLNEGDSIEKIARITGLSIEAIENL